MNSADDLVDIKSEFCQIMRLSTKFNSESIQINPSYQVSLLVTLEIRYSYKRKLVVEMLINTTLILH